MKTLDWVLLIIALIFISSIIILYFYSKSEGGQCLQDPLTFAQDKLGENAICSCSVSNEFNPSISYCASKCPLT